MPSAAAFLAAVVPAPAGTGATASGGQGEAALAFAAALAQVSQAGSSRAAPADESAPQTLSATPPQPGLLKTARHAALALDALKAEAEPAPADLAPVQADAIALPAQPVASIDEPSADVEPAGEKAPAPVDAISEDASVTVTAPTAIAPQAPAAAPPTPAQPEKIAHETIERAPAEMEPTVAPATVKVVDLPAPAAQIENEGASEPTPAPSLTAAPAIAETEAETEVVSPEAKIPAAVETPVVTTPATPAMPAASPIASPMASIDRAAAPAAAQPAPAPVKAQPVPPESDKAPPPSADSVQARDTRDVALNTPPSQTEAVAGSVVVKARTLTPAIAEEAAPKPAAEKTSPASAPTAQTVAPAPAPAPSLAPSLATPMTPAQTSSKAAVAPAAVSVQEIPEDGAEPVTATIETSEATGEVETAKADVAPSTPRLDVPVPPRTLREPPRIHDRVAAVSQDAAPVTTDTDQAGATTAAAQPASTGGSQTTTTAPQITVSETPTPLQPAPATSDAPQAPLDALVETTRAPESAAASASRDLSFSQLSRATVETTAHLAATIARKLEGRSTRFDMVLTPEDLGRVDVSLEIDSDGQLAARLAFDNPAAAADLRSRADELRRQLQDAGFQVTSDSLDFSQRDPSSGGGAFDRQQQRNALFAGGSRLAVQADLAAAPPVGAWTNHSLTPDRVDVRV